MKKTLLFLLFVLVALNGFSQIVFEKGYFIDNLGKKTDCFIKNIDWKNNPAEFEYKLTEDSDVQLARINKVKEFQVLGYPKYERFTVDIDRSGGDVLSGRINFNKKPEFKKETLFLETLIDGDASLYAYENQRLVLFFYRIKQGEVKQLIHRYYKTYGKKDEDGEEEKIGENNAYKQQMFNNLKCKSISASDFNKTKYTKRALVGLFVKYNKCRQGSFINYEQEEKEDWFNLSIRPGINSSSLSIHNKLSNFNNSHFDRKLSFRIGLEAEFVMPFNKDKWAIIVEPTYRYYQTEKELQGQNVKVDYKSIEMPVGIRYYMFLNDESKLFVNASYIIDLANTTESKIDFEVRDDLDIKASGSFVLGMGYNYKKKYSLELRYQFKRNLLNRYAAWTSDFKNLSLILGYNIF